jgi:hypothetical protein
MAAMIAAAAARMRHCRREDAPLPPGRGALDAIQDQGHKQAGEQGGGMENGNMLVAHTDQNTQQDALYAASKKKQRALRERGRKGRFRHVVGSPRNSAVILQAQ